MAKVILNPHVDRNQVKAELKKIGVTVGQNMGGNRYVVYVSNPILFNQFLKSQSL